MNPTSHNGTSTAVVPEEKQNDTVLLTTSNGIGSLPYVPGKGKQEPSLKERAGILLAGAGIVVAVLLLTFGRLVHPPSSAGKTSVFQQKKPIGTATRSTESTIPINDRTARRNTNAPRAQLVRRKLRGPQPSIPINQ